MLRGRLQMSTPRALLWPGVYFALQGLMGLAWWCAITWSMGVRGAFTPDGYGERYLMHFWLPDLVLFVGASFATGVLVLRGEKRPVVPAAITFGAVAYATLTTISSSLATGSAWLAPLVMGCSLAGSFWATRNVVQAWA